MIQSPIPAAQQSRPVNADLHNATRIAMAGAARHRQDAADRRNLSARAYERARRNRTRSRCWTCAWHARRRRHPYDVHRSRNPVEVNEVTLNASAYILRYDFEA